MSPMPHQLTPRLLHRNLTLIEVADPGLLDMLLADRQVGPLLDRRLSPTVAITGPERAPTLLMHLRRLGHFPRLHGPLP